MTNREKFRSIFGVYAEEFWAYPKDKMLDWLQYDVPDSDDGDTISRQAAIEELECVGYDFSESGLSNPELEELCEAIGEVEQDMIMRIRHLPSAQPEIVRCKDCKHREGRCCDYSAVYVRDNGYCQWGERRE